MPLTILVPMILVGLPVVIGLVYLIDKNKERERLSEEVAGKLYRFDFPDAKFDRIILDDASRSGLIVNDNTLLGVVTGVGQNFVTRKIDNRLVENVVETARGVGLQFNDFTLRHIELEVSDPVHRNGVLTLFSSMEN